MTSWRVSPQLHSEFVEMSGDVNPLHTDDMAARRLQIGRVAVHGMHLALDAVERVVAEAQRSPVRVTCTFRHPVGIDDELVTRIDVTDSAAAIDVSTDVWQVATLAVEFGDVSPFDIEITAPTPRQPDQPALDGLEGREGTIPVAADARLLRPRFPNLVERLGVGRVAELVTLTALVGMHVPGLHSLFSGFDVVMGDRRDVDNSLRYRVRRFDERFSLATIDVDGPSITGTVTAFVRGEPVEPSIGDAQPLLEEFAGQRWLVVGGSRGLGAVAAMLLDAGGAEVRLTYHRGRDDAEGVVATTHAATHHRLDVLDPDADLAAITASWQPTHVAYFASPPIFDGVAGAYSPALERRFRRFYIEAFTAVIDRLDRDALRGILWPSSEAVTTDVAGMAEYAAVKRDGEAVCRRLAAQTDDLITHCPRLPRLLTDQTRTFMPVEYGDTATSVLAALRAFSG